MKLTINLATRVYIDQKKVRLFTLLAIVLLSLLLVLNIGVLVERLQETERVKKDLARLEEQKKQVKHTVSDKDYKELIGHIRFANEAIAEKTYNWLGLLDHLESVVPDGVAVTTIEPDQKNGAIRLTGVTRNFSNIQTLMENLETSNNFTRVFLLGHTATKLEDGSNALAFNLTCKAVSR